MRGRILGIGNRDRDSGGAPAAQSTGGIALGTAVGDVILVTEHAPEVLCDVGATVPARARLVALDELQHADHPSISANPNRQRARTTGIEYDGTNSAVRFSKTEFVDKRRADGL